MAAVQVNEKRKDRPLSAQIEANCNGSRRIKRHHITVWGFISGPARSAVHVKYDMFLLKGGFIPRRSAGMIDRLG